MYIMENGTKRAIPNFDTYLKLGIKNVVQMGNSLNDIPSGPDLPSAE